MVDKIAELLCSCHLTLKWVTLQSYSRKMCTCVPLCIITPYFLHGFNSYPALRISRSADFHSTETSDAGIMLWCQGLGLQKWEGMPWNWDWVPHSSASLGRGVFAFKNPSLVYERVEKICHVDGFICVGIQKMSTTHFGRRQMKLGSLMLQTSAFFLGTYSFALDFTWNVDFWELGSQ